MNVVSFNGSLVHVLMGHTERNIGIQFNDSFYGASIKQLIIKMDGSPDIYNFVLLVVLFVFFSTQSFPQTQTITYKIPKIHITNTKHISAISNNSFRHYFVLETVSFKCNVVLVAANQSICVIVVLSGLQREWQ